MKSEFQSVPANFLDLVFAKIFEAHGGINSQNYNIKKYKELYDVIIERGLEWEGEKLIAFITPSELLTLKREYNELTNSVI